VIRQSDAEIALRLAAVEAECVSLNAFIAQAAVRGEDVEPLRQRRDILLNTRWALRNVERYREYGAIYSANYRRKRGPGVRQGRGARQDPASLYRPGEKESLRCPKCRALIVARDFDGAYCWQCGWHAVEVARPIPLEADEVM
jgi:hypothetical protein